MYSSWTASSTHMGNRIHGHNSGSSPTSGVELSEPKELYNWFDFALDHDVSDPHGLTIHEMMALFIEKEEEEFCFGGSDPLNPCE